MSDQGEKRIGMVFRRTYIVPQLRFNEGSGYLTDFRLSAGRLSMKFSKLAPEDPLEKGDEHASRGVVMLSVREPQPEILEMLERTRTTSAPEGRALWDAFVAAKSGVPWDQQRFVMLESMPRGFRDYANSVRERIDDGLKRFVSLLRWRYAQWGAPKAIKLARPIEWSSDNATWYYMPFAPQTSLDANVILAFNEDRRTELISLFEDRNLAEPVYRELLREANELQDSSRRSSLILAVAAAEIAIKVLIQETDPGFYGVDLRSDPAPPATTMYSDISRLRLRHTIHGKLLGVPARLLNELKRAIAARNALAHAGAPPLERDSLIAKINAIHDLVLIVDHYRGFAWALDQVTRETKDELAALAAGHSTTP